MHYLIYCINGCLQSLDVALFGSKGRNFHSGLVCQSTQRVDCGQ